MIKIDPSETRLVGGWLANDGRVVSDETCERISKLVQGYLVRVGQDPFGWDTLYRDPADNRLWELIYPQGHLHGAGPPELRCLSMDEAKQKYDGTFKS